MASINSVGKSSYTSSLYNSANIVSGLASGMDTEGMIESLVQSYSTKITQLNQKATKIQWKQDAYQSIIAKMYAFSNKYTSYMSSTNLSSPSFFNNARTVEPKGKYADKVTASGRTDNDVVLNSVSQLATAARYVTGGNLSGAGDGTTISASEGVDLNADMELGTLQGSLSIAYGNKTVSVSFDENTDKYKSVEDLAGAIREKLSNETITLSGGTSAKASDRIGVQVSDGKITFKDKSGAGNSVYISGASGSVATELDLKGVTSTDKVSEIKTGSGDFTKQVNTGEYLSGKAMNINLDGTTKTIYGPKVVANKDEDGNITYTFTKPSTVKDKNGQSKIVYNKDDEVTVDAKDAANKYAEILNEGVNKAFGDKVTVVNANKDTYDSDKLSLKFTTQDGSNLLINTDAGDALKIGKSATSYLNTNKTLGELMGVNEDGTLKGEGLVQEKDADGKDSGKYAFMLNGEKIGSYDKDTKLADIMNDINANKEANVKVSYSRTTRSFVFESRDTGSQSKVEMGDGLARAMFQQPTPGDTKLGDVLDEKFKYGDTFQFKIGDQNIEITAPLDKDMKDVTVDELVSYVNGALADKNMTASFDQKTGSLAVTDADGKKVDVSYEDAVSKEFFAKTAKQGGGTYTAGQDAKFSVTVNGIEKDMVRGSNSVDIDGLTINFKGIFEQEAGDEGVSFDVSTDSDQIVDVIKDMVKDYNEMMGEIKSAYSTLPYQNSSGAFQSYEPLTDEDKSGMSESAIENYEKKAKQGILFGDSNLKGLYERMYNVFNPSGNDSNVLRNMGLTYSYSSDGTSTLTLDEKKLRSALDSDPDAVMNVFTKTSETGGSSGIMEGMKTQLDRYGATTGAVKGILVQQAGTPLSSLSLLDNQWQKEIDNLGDQITKWQDKLSDRVDYYTNMFSRLEVLINQMNSQSSTLAGLMGG